MKEHSLIELHSLLAAFGCCINSINVETSGYSSGYLTHRPYTVIELTCVSPSGFSRLVECAAMYEKEERDRRIISEKYPAVKEAYEHYKSIETLCNSGK
jgi:hypothetical protein